MPVFDARYPGKCGGCGIPFDAGDPVYYVDGILYAADGCGREEVEEDTAKAREEMCGSCFLVHKGECL